jgi:hypothetical protein
MGSKWLIVLPILLCFQGSKGFVWRLHFLGAFRGWPEGPAGVRGEISSDEYHSVNSMDEGSEGFWTEKR